MGSFQVWDVEFSEEKDRQKFEKLYKIQIQNILVNDNSVSRGFVAWKMTRNSVLEIIYFMGFMGYEEPYEILKECEKKGIEIKFCSFISINDKNSKWVKIKGKW